jgi:site-specific DNA recombinase
MNPHSINSAPPLPLTPVAAAIPKGQRAVIYARFSSDAQRESSIEDQVRVCQKYAEQHGLVIVTTYSDKAEKGWNPERPGYQSMLRAARAGQFDVLVLFDLSRGFRDSVEQAQRLREFAFSDVRVVAVVDGYDSLAKGSKLMATMKGVINEQFSEALAENTHRGLVGQHQAGRSTGGRAYGYRTEPVRSGDKVIGWQRCIVEAEAEVVRSIYEWYANGDSPMDIAVRLNAMRVESPRGGTWSRNAIYGDQQDLSGILSNPIYQGQLVWNRAKFQPNPTTGRRVKRRRHPDEWLRREEPSLRIVSEELVARVQARMRLTAEKGSAIRAALGEKARAGSDGRYMLTGLLRCSTCGGPVSSVAKDAFGCSARHNRGPEACANGSKFRRTEAEAAVLEAVSTEVLVPEAIERFAALLQEELHALDGADKSREVKLRADLKGTEAALANIIAAVEKGQTSPTLFARLTELELRASESRSALEKEAGLRQVTDEDIAKLRDAGMTALKDLPALLKGSATETRTVLGRLLGPVTVDPAVDGRIQFTMTGHIAGLLQLAAVKQRKARSAEGEGPELTKKKASQTTGLSEPSSLALGPSVDKLVSVVAGARFELATFGL